MGPALEVAIGLAVMFFIIALAASSIVEIIGSGFKLRARGLERSIHAMLGSEEVAKKFLESRTIRTLKEAETAWTVLGQPKRTAKIPGAMQVEANRRTPARIPARAFADGVVDVLTGLKSEAADAADLYEKLPEKLQQVLDPMLDETGNDLVALKMKLEQWFDTSMHGLEEMYKRWARKILFIVGLILTLSLNASATRVADRLWSDPISRQSMIQVADDVARAPAATDDKTITTPPANATSFEGVAQGLARLDAANIPLGWAGTDATFGWFVVSLFGWLATALLVMLGAPFWYDILTKLISVRKSLPMSAADDPASATMMLRAEHTRSLFDQVPGDRTKATPESIPAERLFAALPHRVVA